MMTTVMIPKIKPEERRVMIVQKKVHRKDFNRALEKVKIISVIILGNPDTKQHFRI